jgi:uroporphyrinogen III methyltransferase/synthase
LPSYDWILFTSANGVRAFWNRLRDRGLKPTLPSSLNVCAIGPATERSLKDLGVEVTFVPKQYIAESILDGFDKKALQGKRILLARAKIARDVLPKGLKQMGAEVDVVEVYRTVKPKGGCRRLKQLLEKEKIAAITFTSSSTVNHFVDLLKKENLKTCLKGVAIACIGPVTARTARSRGIKTTIQPEAYTVPALAKAIGAYFEKKDLKTGRRRTRKDCFH